MGIRIQLPLDPALMSRQKNREPARVDMSNVLRILDITTHKLYRKAGLIDLLIGINYPRFHVGETKVKDGLVARKKPLWLGRF